MKETDRIFLNTKNIQSLLGQVNEALEAVVNNQKSLNDDQKKLNENQKVLEAQHQRIETLLHYQRELSAQTTALMTKHTILGLVHIGCVYIWMSAKKLWAKRPRSGGIVPEVKTEPKVE